jgi:hydroxyacylglutathione hydrolase
MIKNVGLLATDPE